MQTRVIVLEQRGGLGHADATAGPGLDSGVLVLPLEDATGLSEHVTSESPVLVLAEAAHAGLLGRACGLLAAGTDVPVASRALRHGPLAVRLLADRVAHLDLSPAQAVAALDDVASATWSGAWVPSVAGLDDPSPSLGQHLRSWLPGGHGFLIVHHPHPRVRVVRADAAEELVEAGLRPVLVVAGEGAPVVALEQAQRAASARSRSAVRSLPDARARYGIAAAVELAALPGDLPTAPAGEGTCGGCGLPQTTVTCPFCHRSSVVALLTEPDST